MKKLAAGLLAFALMVMLLPAGVVVSFAASGKLSFSDPTASVGDQISVTMKIAADAALGSSDVMLQYDADALEFVRSFKSIRLFFPKHINGMLGYRTTRSRKNMDTWKFAHDYCGKLWWKIGWLMIIPSALVHIPLYHSDENTIGVAGGILVTIQCIILIVSIYPTEQALKKNFNDDGTRR